MKNEWLRSFFYLFKGKIIYENWIEIWKQHIFLAHNHNCVIVMIIFIKIDINALFGCNLYGTIFHFTYFVNFLQITIPLKTRAFTFYNYWAWYMDSRFRLHKPPSQRKKIISKLTEKKNCLLVLVVYFCSSSNINYPKKGALIRSGFVFLFFLHQLFHVLTFKYGY